MTEHGNWADPTQLLIGGFLGSLVYVLAILALVAFVSRALDDAGDEDREE